MALPLFFADSSIERTRARSSRLAAMLRATALRLLCAAAALWLPAALAQPGAADPAKDVLIPLVKSGRFEEASAVLGKAHAAYERDRRAEDGFHQLAYEFYRADPELEKALDAWVAQRAKDPFGRLARGVYRVKLGWASRGGTWASQTSGAQFHDMAAWFKLAKGDLGQALQQMPRLVEAYCYLIEIDMNEGGRKKRSLYEHALKVNPDSFVAREYFLHSLLPRWGGSYDAMNQVMTASRPSYGRMPELQVLEGKVDADIGDMLRRQGDANAQEAKAYFLRALSKGDFWFTNLQYGMLLYDMDDDKGALEQFNKVIAARPGATQGWRDRARVYRMLMQTTEAMADINRALEIEPRNSDLVATRGLIQLTAGKLELALEDYQAAAALDPADASYAKKIAEIQQELDRRNRAGARRH